MIHIITYPASHPMARAGYPTETFEANGQIVRFSELPEGAIFYTDGHADPEVLIYENLGDGYVAQLHPWGDDIFPLFGNPLCVVLEETK